MAGGSANARQRMGIGSWLRTYFFTGLVIVGPVVLTGYIVWTAITAIDGVVKPLIRSALPPGYDPDKYLPFAIPGLGLIAAIIAITLIGALTANLLGRTLVGIGEWFLGRMPVVRNVYGALKQLFESLLTATTPGSGIKKVGLVEFPSKGHWAIAFITAEATGEIGAAKPGGEEDLVTAFIATGMVPPTGFVCFVPRREIIMLNMSVEDAAKIIVSGGMVTPESKLS